MDLTPENLKSIFDQYFDGDVALWTEFAKFLTVRNFSKGQIIKNYHNTEKFINILVAGSVSQSVLGADKDICISLYYENQLFCDYLSFLTQKDGLIKSEALEDVEIWSITYPELSTLYSNSKNGVIIGKSIADAMFMKKQDEQINLLTRTPTERYLKLMKERPMAFQRTPLKVIASYLGLTAESLSRIRKRIT